MKITALFRLRFSIVLVSMVFLLPSPLKSQTIDSLRIMTYNLMYYRENTSFCTNNNNSATAKDSNIRIILDYVKPDIFVVNEMGVSQTNAPYKLLTEAINKSGRNFWFANSSTNSSQNIMNMLYYNKKKLVLKGQTFVDKDSNNQNITRRIDIYTLYYKDKNLGQHHDTAFIHIVSAHLKAGSAKANKKQRGQATYALMAKLDSIKAKGNYFFMGDLNLYNSSEPAYQNLINYKDTALRFYDPMKVTGNWGASGYASLHTQSTHTSGGCFSTGGMDDRFDFILASNEVLNNKDRIKYLSASYTTVGQDGRRYNSNLISPINNSAPSAVINALYHVSDHIPVYLDVAVGTPKHTKLNEKLMVAKPKFENPTNGFLHLDFGGGSPTITNIKVLNLAAQVVFEQQQLSRNSAELDLHFLQKGMYLIQFTTKNGITRVDKLLIN